MPLINVLMCPTKSRFTRDSSLSALPENATSGELLRDHSLAASTAQRLGVNQSSLSFMDSARHEQIAYSCHSEDTRMPISCAACPTTLPGPKSCLTPLPFAPLPTRSLPSYEVYKQPSTVQHPGAVAYSDRLPPSHTVHPYAEACQQRHPKEAFRAYQPSLACQKAPIYPSPSTNNEGARLELLRLLNPALLPESSPQGVVASLADLPAELLVASSTLETRNTEVKTAICALSSQERTTPLRKNLYSEEGKYLARGSAASSVMSDSTRHTRGRADSRQQSDDISWSDHHGSVSVSEPESSSTASVSSPRELLSDRPGSHDNLHPMVSFLFETAIGQSSGSLAISATTPLCTASPGSSTAMGWIERLLRTGNVTDSEPDSVGQCDESSRILPYRLRSGGAPSASGRFANPSFMRSPEPSEVPFPPEFFRPCIIPTATGGSVTSNNIL